jgi:polar amino acid transport system substrate-binding protein
LRTLTIFVVLICLPIGILAQTIILVVEEWPPYEFTKDGQAMGTDVEILEEVCRRLGLTPQFRFVPWARALKEVQDGKADAIFSAAYLEERAQFLYYPETPLNEERNVFFVRKDSLLHVSGLDNLDGLKIGVVRGNFYGQAFDAYTGAEKIGATDQIALFRLLVNDRVDLIVTADLVGATVAKEMGIVEQVKALDYVVYEEPLYVGFSKAKGPQAQKMAEDFDRILKQLKEEGASDRIFRKYRE